MLYFIFKFLIPVFSFSLSSISTSHCFPSVLALLSSSASEENPSFIIPPSLIPTGGSSTIEESISSKISDSPSICSFRLHIRWDSSVLRTFLMCGIISTEFLNAIKSLGLADLQLIFAIILSRSYTGLRYSRSSSRSIFLLLSSSMASCLLIIDSLSTRGCSIIFLKALAPIAVLVLSRTHIREPFLCFSLNVSTSSRFLLEELSISMYFPVVYGVIVIIWERLLFCVS